MNQPCITAGKRSDSGARQVEEHVREMRSLLVAELHEATAGFPSPGMDALLTAGKAHLLRKATLMPRRAQIDIDNGRIMTESDDTWMVLARQPCLASILAYRSPAR